MFTQTNQPEAFKLVAFLQEALIVTDYLTPTKINSGGCGAFAEQLYLQLERLGYEPEIYALYYDEQDEDGKNQLLEFITNGNNLEQAGEDHIVIKVKDLYFDSTGICIKEPFVAVDRIKIDIDILRKLNEKGRWNPVFDRKCVPTIQTTLQKFFDMFLNEQYVPGELIKSSKDKSVTLSEHTTTMMRKYSNPFASLFEK